VLLTWLAASTLTALLTGLTWPDGAWMPVAAAVIAAQAVVLVGHARLPSWATWPSALFCAAIGGLGHHGADLLVYVGLVAILLLTAGRFAHLSADLSAFCRLEDNAAEPRTFRVATTLADPVAREFARARRNESHLVVVSIAVPETRGAARRLARIARDLVPILRRTDAIVRAITDRLLVVLPGGDNDVATTVLGRALAGGRNDLLVGTATFPEDGPTWETLKAVARAREQPWPSAGAADVGSSTARVMSDATQPGPGAHRAEGVRS
jgi:hypothetical protein